jgi:hypothetical protein
MNTYHRLDPEPKKGNRMPLSEQEQRLLDEMERNLYQNDADFVSTVGARRGKPNYRVVVIGIVVTIVGIITLITGVVVHQPIVGVLGFAVMFGGVLLAFAPPRRLRGEPAAPRSAGPNGAPTKKRSGSFMDTLNERWDRRSDERGR